MTIGGICRIGLSGNVLNRVAARVWRRRGQQPQDPPITRSVAKIWWSFGGSGASTAVTAASAITVDRLAAGGQSGQVKLASSVPSKLASATSSGTPQPELAGGAEQPDGLQVGAGDDRGRSARACAAAVARPS